MAIVTRWSDLVAEVAKHFPEAELDALRTRVGDIGALISHVSEAHDLTFAEAAEMVAFRLPVYLEDARLSA